MLKKMIFAIVALAALSFASSAAPTTGCKKFNFAGTYTRPLLNQDVFGDSSVIHSWVYLLTVHSDGTATQSITATEDYFINTGTSSPWTGSWKCRDDGKLVVTVLEAGFFAVGAGSNTNAPFADIALGAHYRSTYLFSVDSENVLTRIQSRTRTYGENEDPTNLTGGNLGTLRTESLAYTRLVASDADLLLP